MVQTSIITEKFKIDYVRNPYQWLPISAVGLRKHSNPILARRLSEPRVLNHELDCIPNKTMVSYRPIQNETAANQANGKHPMEKLVAAH
jgi:hypothetical protein